MTRASLTHLTRAGVLFALWLLLVDDVSSPQLWTGAVVAILATLLTSAVDRLRSERPRPTVAMLRHVPRALGLLVRDSVRVTWALVLMLTGRGAGLGRLCAAPYGAVGDGPADAARRGLSEWAASLGPNRYVVGCDRDAGTIVVHELLPSAGPLDPLELG
ncbi:MAG TPA: hypothetical protein VFN48_03085 [Solirubrobacteraceae bacterium]|nr:hypothetical protein [Solirubrobacteraceae bacterium]